MHDDIVRYEIVHPRDGDVVHLHALLYELHPHNLIPEHVRFRERANPCVLLHLCHEEQRLPRRRVSQPLAHRLRVCIACRPPNLSPILRPVHIPYFPRYRIDIRVPFPPLEVRQTGCLLSGLDPEKPYLLDEPLHILAVDDELLGKERLPIEMYRFLAELRKHSESEQEMLHLPDEPRRG